MASSKKKRNSTLIILLIVMIAMVGACLWLVNFKDKQAAEKQSEESTEEDVVATVDTDSVESIYFSNENGDMTLVRGDKDVWKNANDDLFPVNQTYVQSMLAGLSSITSSRTMKDETDDLSKFGLDSPSVQVTATLKDGTKTSIAMGASAPVNGGYYATINGGSDIYIISETFYNYFVYSVEQMTTVETIPSITAENITYLKVENKDKPTYEINYDENKPADYASSTFWTMKQPYPTELAADPEAVKTLLGNYTAMSFLSCVNYNADDLSLYGLEDPTATISLKYYEVFTKEKESSESTDSTDTTEASSTASTNSTEDESTKIFHDYKLIIGAKDDDGNYYVKSGDSNAVNTISADVVDKLITIDAYSTVYRYINLVNITEIDKVDVEFNGKTYTLGLEKAEQTKDESTDSTEEVAMNYYFNGKQVKERDFKDLYQLIISTETEREIPEDYTESNASKIPDLTLKFHYINGKTIIVKYLPYNDSYNVVNREGIEYFLTDLRKINEIIDKVQEFQK